MGRIHIDHAGPFMGHTFLIIVDSYSKWIEAVTVPSTSSEATIKVLHTLFRYTRYTRTSIFRQWFWVH